MRILYHHRTRSRDGQSVHIDELTGALRRLGHEVVVVGPQGAEEAPFGADAGGVVTLKRLLPKALYETLEIAYNATAYRRLRRACLEHAPDILYERYNLYLLAGVWLRRRHRLPLLLEVNAPLAEERERFGGLGLRRLAVAVERTTWRAADRVLVVSRVLAGMARQAGVAKDRIAVVPNGIAEATLRATADGAAVRRELGLGKDVVVLGFVGFVREWHRLEAVVDLLADSDPALGLCLLVVGDGPALPGLGLRARERGVADRVTFAGLVPRERVADYVAAFDVALQPHVVGYASPLKLLDYMVMGRAIVAPDTANIRELVADGETALLFEPGRDEAMRAAIGRLCRDPGLRRRLGEAARAEIARRGLTWEENARRVVRIGEEELARWAAGARTSRPQAVPARSPQRRRQS